MWWKGLGIALFIYVLIGGLTVPLGPGIEEINPYQIKKGGPQTIQIKGYNTNFDASDSNTVLIKLEGETYLKAIASKADGPNILNATFYLPKESPSGSFAIITYNEKDGYTVTPDAVFIDTSFMAGGTIIAPIMPSPGIKLLPATGIKFPYRSILNETIRNTFFHVALWMAMFLLFVVANYYAIRYLITKKRNFDFRSEALTKTGILYGLMGLITGSIWARYTWGTWWTNDVKLNMAAIAMIIYGGYVILRASVNDPDKRARISAVFSIFSFVALIPLIFVIPRLNDSLHPGNGGNPALGGEDLDNTLRLFFYPSIIALFITGLWISQLKYRLEKIKFTLLTR